MTDFLVNGEPLSWLQWPKISRLNREIVVTEKIDGTNAQVIVDDSGTKVAAASRKRLITPDDDNYGFARWVDENAAELVKLGPGRHFGEWWGQGVQRGYNMKRKVFSLFNVGRWTSEFNINWSRSIQEGGSTGCLEVFPCDVVPILYKGPMSTDMVNSFQMWLSMFGSQAAPGFNDPEGVVVWHSANGAMFKVTIKGDAGGKGPREE